MYKLGEFLPENAQVTFYDPKDGLPNAQGFDAMLIRTVSKLNPETYPSFPGTLKFVATGSSGTDHVDKEYLKEKNITFADAKGCNARAVAEYVMTGLLLWRDEKEVALEDLSFGIIGAGAAGSAVQEILQDFGCTTVMHDPPRALREPDFDSASIEEVLACDVLSFHVPFTYKGDFPTHHWLNKDKLQGLSFKLIVNAARGGIIDEAAVSEAMDSGAIQDIIIDVWEHEPDFDPGFADRAFIATPHIAGYSEQAKLNASKMACEALCEFFGLHCPPTRKLYDIKKLRPAHLNYSEQDILNRLHPIKEYDAALRDLYHRDDKTALFAKLREDRPYRFEYGFIELEAEFLGKFPELVTLGVQKLKT